MKSCLRRLSAAAIALLLLLPLCSCSGGLSWFTATRLGLFDTFCTVTAYAANRASFERAAETIFEMLAEYDRMFDIYRAYEGEANLKTVNDRAGQSPVAVPEETIGLLSFSREMYDLTDGAFNVMIGALTSVWHEFREADNNELPSEEMLAEAKKHIGIEALVIDEENGTVFISDPDASLDVGAAAKGYAGRLVRDRLSESGLTAAILNLGGNVVACGTKPDGSPWRVAVENGNTGGYEVFINAVDLAVVTSGNYQRYYTVDGVRYPHIIDPETGWPADTFSQVTVACSDPALADALSTAFFVLGRDWRALPIDWEEVGAYFQRDDSGYGFTTGAWFG